MASGSCESSRSGRRPRFRGRGTKCLSVPCTIEFEAAGQKRSQTLKGLRVQELPMQPGRWVIQTFGN